MTGNRRKSTTRDSQISPEQKERENALAELKDKFEDFKKINNIPHLHINNVTEFLNTKYGKKLKNLLQAFGNYSALAKSEFEDSKLADKDKLVLNKRNEIFIYLVNQTKKALREGNLIAVQFYFGQFSTAYFDPLNKGEKKPDQAIPWNNNEFYPLHEAIQSNNKDLIAWLLEKGANINQPSDVRKITPLLYAIELAEEHNAQNTIEYLIEKKADVAQKNKDSHSPLYTAIMYYLKFKFVKNDETANRYFSIIKTLLKANANPNEKFNIELYPSEANGNFLALAAFFKDDELVNLLLDYKANIEKNRAFFYACQFLPETTIKRFIEIDTNNKGSIINSKFLKIGATPIQIAIAAGRPELVKSFITVLEEKLTEKDLIKLLNNKDNFNQTALMYACNANNREIIELLIQYNIDIGPVNSSIINAFDEICKHGGIETVDVLYQHLAKNKSKDELQQYLDSALYHAVRFNRLEITQYLIEKGARIFSEIFRNAESYPPILCQAVYHKNGALFDLILTQSKKDLEQATYINENKRSDYSHFHFILCYALKIAADNDDLTLFKKTLEEIQNVEKIQHIEIENDFPLVYETISTNFFPAKPGKNAEKIISLFFHYCEENKIDYKNIYTKENIQKAVIYQYTPEEKNQIVTAQKNEPTLKETAATLGTRNLITALENAFYSCHIPAIECLKKFQPHLLEYYFENLSEDRLTTLLSTALLNELDEEEVKKSNVTIMMDLIYPFYQGDRADKFLNCILLSLEKGEPALLNYLIDHQATFSEHIKKEILITAIVWKQKDVITKLEQLNIPVEPLIQQANKLDSITSGFSENNNNIPSTEIMSPHKTDTSETHTTEVHEQFTQKRNKKYFSGTLFATDEKTRQLLKSIGYEPGTGNSYKNKIQKIKDTITEEKKRQEKYIDCSWGGSLFYKNNQESHPDSPQDHPLIRPVDGKNVKNLYFYCPQSIQDELKDRKIYDYFKDALTYPKFVPPIDKTGIKKLKMDQIKVDVKIGEKTYKDCHIAYEVKQKHSMDRLLCVEIPSDDKGINKQGTLIVPIRLELGGLHDKADKKSLKDSINQVTIDITPRQKNATEKPSNLALH